MKTEYFEKPEGLFTRNRFYAKEDCTVMEKSNDPPYSSGYGGMTEKYLVKLPSGELAWVYLHGEKEIAA